MSNDASSGTSQVSPWNVPNALTVLRLLMVPLFAWMLLSHPDDPVWRWATTGVFVLAMLTDLADGKIARRYNIVTDFGKLADPIADKAMTGMAFVGLSIIGELWWWVTIVILVREWGITVMRFAIIKWGVMAANRGGKLKTVFQTAAIILALMPLPDLLRPVAWVVMAIALLLTVLTGLDYVREAAKLRRSYHERQAGGFA
ncbi:CDP-diacylglycerol--glycerol-3-phosphate 3-phosphatidyltransferase [Parenemella sanctibonifatiensis]|nr:CDP-diacylglycerol--glycerol-3-phosphate 3-phosphatidyltransferase [Parenemella sanctibonifatiensis]